MKQFFIALSILSMVACGNQNKTQNETTKKTAEKEITIEKSASEAPSGEGEYASFGEKILADAAIGSEEMYGKFQNMKVGDTLNVKFTSQVATVCKKKGCWMELNLPNGEKARVSFKDYAFFVPKDIENQTVIVEGKAFVTVLSVEDLRHYAADGGQSKAEIATITEPEKTMSIEATGVLIKE